MQVAPPTANEDARLKALLDYDVLDTEAERVFDDITLLASQICDTPIALISLVDPDRQWFKSKIGLDATETPRDLAFCAHAIHQNTLFEVEDALEDPRFFDNPLVTDEPKVRFYAGTPLLTPEGLAIGTLCTIDNKPKKLSEFQANALAILGRNVISQMELRRKIKLLDAADKNKSDFLSKMSHELRTPLNAIIGFSGLLLQDQRADSYTAQAKEYLQHIDFSGKRLLSVINAILDINKIEAGMMSLHLSPVNIRALITQLSGILTISAVEKSVDFTTFIADEVPDIVLVDEGKFGQIIINLVSNGIKYTPSHRSVRLAISSGNESLTIAIADQGVGISQGDQAKLFGQFQRVGVTNKTQGSGLGLVITKGLVELMGGRIDVDSSPNEGSVFTVKIPLAECQQDVSVAVEPLDNTPSFSPQSRILVVEDNEINQVVITAMLASYQLSATIVDSGEGALAAIKAAEFDLILMDIHLPGINGIEASQTIRKTTPTQHIVALSADTFEREKMQHSTLVFDDFLTKPVESDKLLSVLTRFLPKA